MKIFDDRVAKFRPASIAIQIFNSQNEPSASLTRAFLRTPESDRMTKVQVTRRRWSNPAAVGNFRFQIADLRLA
jgi:hypothetical protein